MKRLLIPVALVAVAGCTAKAGGEQVEKKITEIYAAEGVKPSKVTCPKAIDVKVGTSFTCQAAFDSGETFVVDGTITSKKGTDFEYNVKMPEPNYISAKLEKMIVDGITAQRSAPKSVTCGTPGLHHSPANHVVDCVAVDGEGNNHKVVFKFTEAGAADAWEVVD